MRKYGILVISHGSRSGDWVRLVEQAVGLMRLPEGTPVECAFLEVVKGRLIQDGMNRLQARGVTDLVVIPLFVSSGSTHIDEISYALGVVPEPMLATDLRPFNMQARVHFCSTMDDDAEIVEILYEKLQSLSVRPEAETVLLVGHGSNEKGFHTKWSLGLQSLARQLLARGGFAAVEGAMLLPDQVAGRMERLKKQWPNCEVLVAPLFLSEGYFTSKVIPVRLKEFSYRYNGAALLPSPWITRWLEKKAAPYLQ